MGIFDTLGYAFNNRAQTDAANAQVAGINTGVSQALPNYIAGINSLTQNYGTAVQPWDKLARVARPGLADYGKLIGLGGPGSTADVLAALEKTPGFQFARQQGDNSILAARAAGQGGGLGSGNTLLDLSKFNQGLATETYQNAVRNALPYFGLAQTAAAGQSGVYQNLGSQLNDAWKNVGNMYYGADTSIGNARANADLGNLTASSNLWGLGSNLLSGLLKFGSPVATALATGSDVRIKEDVEPVGALADGQTVYRYRYTGSPRTHIGLIAQETEPEAVGEVAPGVLGVDYHRATDRAAALLRFSAGGDRPPVRRYTRLMEMAA